MSFKLGYPKLGTVLYKDQHLEKALLSRISNQKNFLKKFKFNHFWKLCLVKMCPIFDCLSLLSKVSSRMLRSQIPYSVLRLWLQHKRLTLIFHKDTARELRNPEATVISLLKTPVYKCGHGSYMGWYSLTDFSRQKYLNVGLVHGASRELSLLWLKQNPHTGLNPTNTMLTKSTHNGLVWQLGSIS